VMTKPVTRSPIATCTPLLKPSLLIDIDSTSFGVVDCDVNSDVVSLSVVGLLVADSAGFDVVVVVVVVVGFVGFVSADADVDALVVVVVVVAAVVVTDVVL